MQWSVRPFVRLVIFYMLGIIAGNKLSLIEIGFVPAIVVFILLLTIAILFAKYFSSYKKRWLAGVVFYTLSLFAGCFNIYFTNKPLHQETDSQNSKTYIGEIVSDIVITAKSVRFEIIVESSDSLNNLSREKVIAYFETGEKTNDLVYGDKIILEAKPALIKNKGNPAEFDYKSYLIHEGIAKSVYLKNEDWKFLKHDPSNLLIDYARSLRRELLRRLETHMFFHNTFPVAAAILVGYDTLMDEKTENSYVHAGAMHILCVSGLHVGVIFILMTLLLKFMLKSKTGRFLRIIILLISIWAYALLTGMSPSVQRASIMFSFFVIGQGLSRPKDSYNTLAASAFVMLAINPNLLFHVGFQLSYAAVLGIISVYPSLYRKLYFKNKAIDYLWSIICVSIAAQLATFPIGTHYFNYFPNYFWITNLVVIPASFVIIISGFLFFLFSWVPYFSAFLGVCTSFMVMIVNYLVSLVEILPYFGTDNIYMPWTKTIIIYLIIIMLFHILIFKRVRLLLYFASALLILIGINTIVKFDHQKNSKLIIYNVNNQDVIQFVDGVNSFVLTSETKGNKRKIDEYVLNPSNIKMGVKNEINFGLNELPNYQNKELMINGNFIQFKQSRYLILSGEDTFITTDSLEKLNINTLIITGKHKVDLNALKSSISFDEIIISSGVPFWKRKKLIEHCEILKVRYIDINKEGGKVFDI
ncbi:MAG: hypothetical protein C0595_01080 [Marinilabiliales bacterium]|nr:MAG: hypothetical protein C0595_01080 [Marinilabiliales bacterium]